MRWGPSGEMTTSTSSPGPAGQSRTLAGLSEKLHPASSWATVTRTRMPATVPFTWCSRLTPQASSGSNGTQTRALFPGSGSSVVVYARVRSTDVTGRVSRTYRDYSDAVPDPGVSLFPIRRLPAIIVVMTDGSTTVTLAEDAPTAVELLLAVRGGDVDLVRRLLSENPDLARARFGARERGTRTALHFVADWPGYFPNGPDIVKLLIDAGADPNALTTSRGSESPGPGSETPLHWAASSDDVDVAVALIDGGADLETPDGSIGTPLDNAVGYGCWHVARLLVLRGARVEKVWHAGALGMLDRLDDLLVPETDPEQISQGFWHACAAGQRRAAERLLRAGADLNWEPDYAQGTALDAATGLGTRQNNVIEWLRSLGARSAQPLG